MNQSGATRQDEAFAPSDDLLAASLAGASLGMVISDACPTGHPVVFANDAFLALTGYARDEVLGRDLRELVGDGALAGLEQALGSGSAFSAEAPARRKDGTPVWVRLDVSPIRRPDGGLRGFLCVHADETARRAAARAQTGELEAALEQQSALLHEVDHRVKNNLQLISSLLMLQSRRMESPDARDALGSMLERVNAVATVHRRLSRSERPELFELAECVRDLVADLARSAGRENVVMRLDLEPVAIPANQAAPVALLITELVSNALKHAFPEGRSGAIDIALARNPEGFEFGVADDGVGGVGAPKGFGSTIIQLLCRQLRAEIEVVATQPGQRVLVRAPLQPAT